MSWSATIAHVSPYAIRSSSREFSIVVAKAIHAVATITVAFFLIIFPGFLGPSWEIVDYVPLLILVSFLFYKELLLRSRDLRTLFCMLGHEKRTKGLLLVPRADLSPKGDFYKENKTAAKSY